MRTVLLSDCFSALEVTQDVAAEGSSLVAPEPEPERLVLCRDCGATLTRESEAMEVGGCHDHTFRNPAGYSFHLQCFGRAEGCSALGPATTAATWFAGCAWRVVVCASCQQHLGWSFQGADQSFYGLIATRLDRG